MNKHTFKVGDKGHTRGGIPFEVIAVAPNASENCRLVVLMAGDNVERHYESGLYFEGKEDHRDLLRPTRKVFVNFYENGTCAYFDDADAAPKGAARASVKAFGVAVPVEIPL